MPGSPVFNDKTFDRFQHLTGEAGTARMTVEGTVNKGIILLGLAVVSGAFSWTIIRTNPGVALGLIFVGLIGGVICALITSFKPQAAPISGPLYSVLEGLVLGAISSVFETKYQGIVLTAVVLTMGLLLLMFVAYRTRILRATPAFARVIVAATGAIALAYIIEMVARMFGARDLLGLWSNGPLGIGISLVIIAVAAFNFILDFDRIERGAEQGAPKFMEWYAAFGVMVTLFWLYLEILRLLAKLQDRR